MLSRFRRQRTTDPETVAPDPVPPTLDAAAPAPVAPPADEVVEVVEVDEAAELLAEADRLVAEDRILDAIDRLSDANRRLRDPRVESRLVHLRHHTFAALDARSAHRSWPPEVPDQFPDVDGCPEIERDALTADVLASAITHHGCLLVRGLLDPVATEQMVGAIDESFRACDAKQFKDVDEWPGSWFQPFRPAEGYPPPELWHRAWVRNAGGVLAADSPPAFFTMIDLFQAAGLREVIDGYLGERPVFALDKVTLRRVPLDLESAEWHQDGSFLGDGIRALNVWLALSDCGGDEPSPGLDLVPKRFDELLPTATDGAYFDWSVGHDLAVRESVDAPIIRPAFRAGDALLFDELFLHRTALEPTQTRERYAIESWFFAGSCYPGESVPIVF